MSCSCEAFFLFLQDSIFIINNKDKMQETLNYIQENIQRFVDELFELLKIASISADPSYKDEVLKCADTVAGFLKSSFLMSSGSGMMSFMQATVRWPPRGRQCLPCGR